MFSPFLLFSLVPLFTSLPILASFCFRSGNVFAEGVSPGSLGYSSWDVSQRLLATVLRSQWPCDEPAPYSEWHKASSAFNKSSKEMHTMSVTQERRSDTEREPDRHRQWVYHFGEHMIQTHCCFKHFPLLYSVISALVWFEGHICLFFSYSNFPKLKNAMTMIWGKLESHLTFSKLYIPQFEKLSI